MLAETCPLYLLREEWWLFSTRCGFFDAARGLRRRQPTGEALILIFPRASNPRHSEP